jgi:hypothetical protein
MRAFLLLLALLPLLATPARAAADFDYGPRPSIPVFDPSHVLSPEEITEISAPLSIAYQRDKIDVMVVVLPELGSAPPEHVAKSFAEAWCKSPLHCVVLHVPGRLDSPWLVPAGKLLEYISQEEIRSATTTAHRHAAAEEKDANKLKAASGEAIVLVRYWQGNVSNQNQLIQNHRIQMQLDQETQARNWQIAGLMALASAVVLVAGYSFISLFLRRRGPAYFPEYESLQRLGAPHAGGNHATIQLDPPQS